MPSEESISGYFSHTGKKRLKNIDLLDDEEDFPDNFPNDNDMLE